MEPRLPTVSGVRLEYRRIFQDRQRPGSPTLVLLHEGLGCVGLWKDFPERLAAATCLRKVLRQLVVASSLCE